jgi:hypothetical protein
MRKDSGALRTSSLAEKADLEKRAVEALPAAVAGRLNYQQDSDPALRFLALVARSAWLRPDACRESKRRGGGRGSGCVRT